MSELKEALQAILRVNFRDPVPAGDQQRLAEFIERAAVELQAREQRVSEREQAVSARESAVSLREDESAAQVKALTSMRRVASVLELQPVKHSTGMRRWMPGRR